MKTYHYYKNYSTQAKIIAWLIDIFGGTLYKIIKHFLAVFRCFVPRINKHQVIMQRILLIRLDHIGDVLMTTPAIRALKQHFPEKSITMLVSPSSYPIVEGNPDIDRIYTFKVPWFDGKRAQRINIRKYLRLIRALRREHIDIAVDFRGDFRTLFFFSFLSGAKHRVGFKGLGGEFLLTTLCEYDKHKHFVGLNLDLIKSLQIPVNRHEIQYSIHTSAEDKVYIDKMFVESGISREDIVVGIHPATIAHWTLKRWKKGRFAELADILIAQYGVKIVFTGGSQELDSISYIVSLMQNTAYSVAGKTSLKQLIELIKRCHLFISNDTGPMHIAVAVETPLVAIFGPTDPQKSGPYGNPDLYRIVKHNVPCRRPCFVSECPRNHECIENITVKHVLHACQSFLKKEVNSLA